MSTPSTTDAGCTEDYAERLLYNLTSLSEIGGLFASETDFEKVAETALRGVMGAVAVSRGALLVLDTTGHRLTCSVARGIRPGPVYIEVDERLNDFLTHLQEPLALSGREGIPEVLKGCEKAIRQLRAQLWVPLVVGNELLGLLSLGEKFLEGAYGDDDLALLWTIGRHFSIGLYNQQLIAQIREVNFQLNRRVVELETLYDAGLTLSKTLQVEAVIEEVLMLAVGVVDARSGFLLLKDGATGRLSLDHQIGLDEAQCRALTTPTIRRRMTQIIRNQKPLHLGTSAFSSELGVDFALVVPLQNLGVLGVVDKESREGILDFGEPDAHLLELMGQQAGSALANARLYRDILEVKNYNQNILSSIGSGVISTDLKGRIVQANPSAARIFGDGGVPLGKSCSRFFRLCGCKGIAEAVAASLLDGEDRPVEGEVAPEYGVTLNARITALRDDQEEVQGLVIALEDLTEEQRVRTMFKQYTSDQVVDLLLDREAAPALGGEERDVTILFVDIRNSTALLGRIGAEEMVASLNDCFSRMNEIIFHYNGTFDKYTGDGFMVVYGAPLAFPDDSERAVRSALAMRDEMVRFNRRRGEPIGMAFGISRGRVLAGNIGSLRRMEYTVYGPNVNLAARFCDGAGAGEIWTGPEIYEELKDLFDFDCLGRQRFRGFDPLDVYEVIGPEGLRKKGGKNMADKPKKVEKKVDLTIPMVPEMELAATRTAEAVAEFMRMDEDKIEEIKMALIEACINAFEHSQSKDRRVFIDFDIGDDELTIRISDRGQGFDPAFAREEVVHKRERGESRRGWGLKIMEELMDEVAVQSDEHGTAITMMKRR